jgi:hypothetical protein
MTAEVAVMNCQAVALAADSAMTINYPDGQKIYNSVNKLFMLSKYAPVGIMVYGVGNLTGVPWETIIKCFRGELGEERLPHLRDYADRLIAYINGHKFMFTEGLQEQQLFGSVVKQFRPVLDDIDRKIREKISQTGPIGDRQVRAIVAASIRNAHSLWTSADRLPGTPANHARRIRQQWRRHVEAAIDYTFQNLPIDPTPKNRLIDIASLVFTANLFPDNVSGVVVAGFGEEDYLPSVVSFDMEGVLLSFVKVRQNAEKSAIVDARNPAAIIPFAQGEMVSLFLEGIDPAFRQEVEHALEDFVAGLADAMVISTDATGRRESTLRRQLDQARAAPAKQFFERLDSYSAQSHVQPVVSAVANLPKEELAGMAESLVSLTSFKRRVTHDPETVGGPIDVAVISKGDGFIWINRKHYFDAALNHQYFANYYPAGSSQAAITTRSSGGGDARPRK